MESLLILALVTCTESPSVCTKTEGAEGLYMVQVCDIAPEEVGASPVQFKALLEDGVYYFTLEPKCKDV
jgi:hypothetical protein